MTTAATYWRVAGQWGSDLSGVLVARFWGFFVAAFVLAAAVAKEAYDVWDVPQKYTELIVGSITWSFQNKFHDYSVLYAFVFAFLFMVGGIAALAARLRQVDGMDGVEQFHDCLLILCIPAALWLAGLWTSKSVSLDLLAFSQVLLAVALLVYAPLAFCRATFWTGPARPLTQTAHEAILFVVLSAFAVAAVGVTIDRLGGWLHIDAHGWMTSAGTAQGMRRIAIVALLWCGVLVGISRDPETLARRMRGSLLVAEGFLPLFLLCLIPPTWRLPAAGGSPSVGYPLSAFAWILVLASIIAAYVELFVHARAQRPTNGSALRTLTVGSVIGLLLFLKISPIGLPSLPSDDYHFGEMLVPWWSWSQMGLIPFWDYAPARGLINYFPSWLSGVLFDGSPASIVSTYPFVYAALAVVAVPVLRRSVGIAGAFMALLLGPFANSIGEIDVAVSIFLFAFCWGWLHWSPVRWLAGFTVAGIALLLYAPGQGALVLLSFAPFVAWAILGLYRFDRRHLGRLLIAIAAPLALVSIVTPFGKMLFGALRYGAEQSQINSIAHGINWNSSFGLAGLNPWAFEIMRASFVLVALWGGVMVFKALVMPRGPDRVRILVYATPVFLLGLLYVVRAAGRIDPGGSRLAFASVWASALLLPMLLFVSVRMRAVHYLIWAAIMGIALPSAFSLSSTGYAGNFDPIDPSPLEQRPNSRSIAGGRLGSAVADPRHMERIEAVRKVLDQVLDPSETYLDLSGRHAMYYYVNRRPAIESAAMYNLVSENQQLRAIESMRAAHLPAVLLSADNIVHDGGPSSLRSNLVYREVLLSTGYQLATIGQQVWMIRADRVARLSPGQASSLVDLDAPAAVGVLDPIFHQPNIEAVPASWGRSFASLENELVPVSTVPSDVPTSVNDVRLLGPGRYAIAGGDPFVRFDISSSKLRGRQAGILSFEFACEIPSAVPGLGMYWATSKIGEGPTTFFAFQGRQGRLLVPIDSAPSWLLADRVDTLRFDLDSNLQGCETFSIRNVQLMARRAALP